MPLLLCPNDNASMTSVGRGGVEFDMCPVCRGVWLDRGELEKLMEMGSGTSEPVPYREPQPYRETSRAYPSSDRDSYRPRDRDDDDYKYRKKRRLDIFDIFD